MSGAKVSAAAAPKSVPSPSAGVVGKRSRGPRFKPQTAVSRDAQRLAAVILEVLAGARTPTDAAAAVSLSVPRYYLWEQRALEGLVRACEPRPKGKVASERCRIAALEKEVVRLRQDCTRQQALVRASQRTMGLAASPPAAAKPVAKPAAKTADGAAGKKKRKRRPVARALKAVAALQAAPGDDHDHEYMVPDMVRESPADSSSTNGAEVVQRSTLDSLLRAAAEADAVGAVSPA